MSVIIIIISLAGVSELAAILAPEGKTKKLLNFIYAVVAVFAVASGVQEAFLGISGTLFLGGQNSVQTALVEKYDENLSDFYSNYYFSKAKTALKKEGIGLIYAKISLGRDSGDFAVKKIEINVSDLVIIGENPHINISQRSKEILQTLFSAEKTEVFISDE